MECQRSQPQNEAVIKYSCCQADPWPPNLFKAAALVSFLHVVYERLTQVSLQIRRLCVSTLQLTTLVWLSVILCILHYE